jgi:hypothetical protein
MKKTTAFLFAPVTTVAELRPKSTVSSEQTRNFREAPEQRWGLPRTCPGSRMRNKCRQLKVNFEFVTIIANIQQLNSISRCMDSEKKDVGS